MKAAKALAEEAGIRRADDGISQEMRALSAYIAGALRAPLAEDVLEKGRHHLVDTVAAMVSGSHLKPGVLAISYVRALGGAPDCTVIGAGFLTNALNAALANGIMAHADETDDSHLGGRFHPGCGIVPGALAAAELKGESGANLLKAVILGYDIGTRFNLSLGPRKLYAGGHSTHSVGPLFGAAAAAAALLRLDGAQVRHMLSYAVQQASGVQCWARDDQHIEKAFDFGGMTARDALTAATMVAAGFTGVDDALSGENNFYTAFATDPRPEELGKGLGTRFEILKATIKKWCVGSPIQGAVDAVTLLMEQHAITAADVAKIVLELPDDRAKLVDNRTMPNINVQHLVALALVDGGMTFASAHDHARMADPAVVDLRKRIELIANPELTTALPPRQVIMKITTKDGRELAHRTHAVKGTPDNPMTRQEVFDKALDLVGPIVGGARGRELVSTLMAIDKVDNVLTLRPLLQA
ncbi:MAG TPA: MmgE/PrpD family protein [Beijerinckiaceae bacterium]